MLIKDTIYLEDLRQLAKDHKQTSIIDKHMKDGVSLLDYMRDGGTSVWITRCYDLSDIAVDMDWDNLCIKFLVNVLYHQPDLKHHFNRYSELTMDNWENLLSVDLSFETHFRDWSEISGHGWAKILSRQPIDDYCYKFGGFSKMNNDDWALLISEKSYFYENELFKGFQIFNNSNWLTVLHKQPQFLSIYEWEAQGEPTNKRHTNNTDLYLAFVKWQWYEENGIQCRERDRVHNYLGKCFIKMTDSYLSDPCYSGYTVAWKNEMRSLALHDCTKALSSFNGLKGTYPHAYLSTSIKNAFLRTIGSEKEKVVKFGKILSNMDDEDLIQSGYADIQCEKKLNEIRSLIMKPVIDNNDS